MKNLTSLILIAVAIGVFFINIRPGYEEVKRLRAEQVKYDDALLNTNKLKDLRASLDTKLAAFLPEDLEKLERAIPENSDAVGLAKDIDSIAVARGIRIKEIKTGGKSSTPNLASQKFAESSVSFELKTSYDNFLAFIGDIEKNIRIVDITALTVRPIEEAPGFFNFSLSMQAYSLNK